MPAAPESIVDHPGYFDHQLGYYACLQSFLTYSFGWTRPDKGLLWWYRAGQPTHDPRLALVSSTWEHDRNLMGFFAWASTQSADALSAQTLAGWARNTDQRPLDLDDEWTNRLRRELGRPPWNGGSDPFHLGGGAHVAAPSRPQSRSTADTTRLLGADSSRRHATYVSDTITGWYANLIEAGSALPPLLDSRSWHVDVYVRPIGFLGTYRESRDTGLWFTGPHRYHVVGN